MSFPELQVKTSSIFLIPGSIDPEPHLGQARHFHHPTDEVQAPRHEHIGLLPLAVLALLALADERDSLLDRPDDVDPLRWERGRELLEGSGELPLYREGSIFRSGREVCSKGDKQMEGQEEKGEGRD